MSIRISHPSGSSRTRQPKPLASSLPRWRPRNVIGARACPSKSHRTFGSPDESPVPTPRWLTPTSRIEPKEPGRRGSNQTYELEWLNPQPWFPRRPTQLNTRPGSNRWPVRITCHPARASLCAKALRARIGLVLAALRWTKRRASAWCWMAKFAASTQAQHR